MKKMKLPVALIIAGLLILLAYITRTITVLGGLPMLIGVILIGIGVVLYINTLNGISRPVRHR